MGSAQNLGALIVLAAIDTIGHS